MTGHIGLSTARTHLSALIERTQLGERITITSQSRWAELLVSPQSKLRCLENPGNERLRSRRSQAMQKKLRPRRHCFGPLMARPSRDAEPQGEVVTVGIIINLL
jgi:prevent-host-death family protein